MLSSFSKVTWKLCTCGRSPSSKRESDFEFSLSGTIACLSITMVVFSFCVKGLFFICGLFCFHPDFCMFDTFVDLFFHPANVYRAPVMWCAVSWAAPVCWTPVSSGPRVDPECLGGRGGGTERSYCVPARQGPGR